MRLDDGEDLKPGFEPKAPGRAGRELGDQGFSRVQVYEGVF
jgi:hypothetical protein